MVEPDAHPPEELLFRWRGGHEVLNFTATVGERWRHGIERLREPGDLSRWLVDAGLAPAPVSVTRRDLNEARALREAMYRVATAVRTGQPVDPNDLATVNRWSGRSAGGPRLEQAAVGLRAVLRAASARDHLSWLATQAAALFGGPAAAQVRECAHPECPLLFLEDRRGARRWCSMDDCGARSKMRAYRARRAAAAT